MVKVELIRHSLAHILAMAVLKKYPGAKLGIGPAIEKGFYYDFQFPKGKGISESDFPALEEEMRFIIKSGCVFSGAKITPAKARALFKDQPFKLELIKEFAAQKKQLIVYSAYSKTRDPKSETRSLFTDLCRGGHIKDTSEISPEAFKLTKITGAYWRGDEKKPMLTRIYGAAFETKKELDDHLAIIAEAEKRDHKKLGKELDLFVFSDLVGSGLPLFTPKGTIIRDELENFIWSLRKQRGYERVRIPHIARKELYETSGHWDKFKDELFRIQTREGHEFALKPMNCPHHAQLYNSQKRSYRELPIRYAETTAVYRDEQSGELSGLSRVRAITQDDSHIFCRMNQIEKEASDVLNIVQEFYRPFGIPLETRLSRHNPKNRSAYLGSDKKWQSAEKQLRSVIVSRVKNYEDAPGEAAFYGPKIDFIGKDALSRSWQVATIQLDFNQPERFGLVCVNEEGRDEQVVMMHVAVMGAVERFMALLIEHYGGAFPLWLSPVQVAVLPVGANHEKYAGDTAAKLRENSVRAEVRGSGETLGKRIRLAELQKIPYIAVVGDKEQLSGAVNLRVRGKGNIGQKKTVEFLTILNTEIKKTFKI